MQVEIVLELFLIVWSGHDKAPARWPGLARRRLLVDTLGGGLEGFFKGA